MGIPLGLAAAATAMDCSPCDTISAELALAKGDVISLNSDAVPAPDEDRGPPSLDDSASSDGTSSSGECFERNLADDDLRGALADIETHAEQPPAWGPDTFEARGGVEALESNPAVLKMPAHYDAEALMNSLAAHSASEASFFVVDLTTVLGKLAAWRRAMPRVRPYYAVKCNGDEAICRLLAASGCGFDCASMDEIKAALAWGAPAQDVIYANPCKQKTMLRYAREAGVLKMTADNTEELHKIRAVFPEARVVLRIAVDDSKSVCRFNSKFGAPQKEWDTLLRTAQELGLDIIGFSFHVGSGCGELQPFADAVASAREAFDLAAAYGFTPTLLDCGGGWPGADDGNFTFAQVAGVVSAAIEQHFPESSGVDVIAEPGRYMVCQSHTYAVTVIAKRQLSAAQVADAAAIESFGSHATKDSEDGSSEVQHDDAFNKADNHTSSQSESTPEVALFLNDGVYGSFNCVVFDHADVKPHVLSQSCAKRPHNVPTKLFGPTCDSIDVVMPCTPLPEMHVGEWIYFNNMGAYTRCAASLFNGQGIHDIYYVWAGMPQIGCRS